VSERPRYDHPTVFNYLHDYGCDLRARRVFFHHWMGLSEDSHELGVEFVTRNLLHLDKSDGRIELWINNPGGYLSEMWGVIDILRICNNPVDTIAYGNVSSAACLLLASGTGARYAMENASFMWHAGTTEIDQEMHWADARDRMRWEERESTRWIETMAKRTKPCNEKGKRIGTRKGKVDFWKRYAEGGGELWLDAEQMIKHGVVDQVWLR